MVDAARVVVLWALVAAAVLLLPYLLADIVSMPWSWFPDGGDWPADLRDAGLAVAGMTALACAVVVIGLLVPAAAVFSWAVLATLLGGGLLYVVRLVGGLRRVKRAGYVVAVDPDTGTAVVRVTGARISAGDRLRVGAAEPARAKVRSMEVAEPVAVAAAGPPQPAPLPTDVRVQVDPGTSMEVGDEVFVEQSVSGSRHE